MNKSPTTDPVIVIIATSFARTNLLFERSLKSVYNQTNINPHQIYIVDDNPKRENEKFSDEWGNIKKVVKQLRDAILKPKYENYKKTIKKHNLKFESFFHTTVIQNTRTKGFSGTGAWNTAAFKSLKYSGRRYFLAFLDDDDEWENNYLEVLNDSVLKPRERKVDGHTKEIKAVASIAGILRIEKKKEIEIQPSKKTFIKEIFFIKNPGLQGSNLFIEQKTFWRIGGFDESLKSATDRDLAIRLIEYVRIRPSKEMKFIEKILVKHYANSEKRVTSNTDNKKNGLDTFYRKYFHQFSQDLQFKSLNRAKKLFNYSLPEISKPKEADKNNFNNLEGDIPFNLIIGAISNNSKNLTELFKAFLILYNKHGELLNDYRFFILENTDNEYDVRPICEYFKNNKVLKIEYRFNDLKDQSIASNRTLLQTIIHKEGQALYKDNFITWIIDDDALFNCDTFDGNIIPNYFQKISCLSNRGFDAVFGLVSDAPPLPFLNTLRTQLIDFYYNLTYFTNCNPNDKFNLNVFQKTNLKSEEFYYDLSSKSFQHLEYPYFWTLHKELTNAEAFKVFLSETASLSKGINVFRKLTYAAESIGEVTKESIYRGGNTIIFNSELLKTKNYTPAQEYNRRSDFNWAIINKFIFDKKQSEVILPLKHDRKLQEMSLLTNEEKLQADIKGLIFYRFLKKILSNQNWEDKLDYRSDIHFYNRIKKDTLAKIKINNYRIVFLIHLILYTLKDVKFWWFDKEHRNATNYIVHQNIFVMEVLKVELGKRKFQTILQDLDTKMKIDDVFIKKIISDIKEIKKTVD